MQDVEREENAAEEPGTGRDYMGRLDTAVRIVGDKWTLLIVGPLLRGPRRFNSLLGFIDGMTGTTLARRLQGLEAAGVVVRRQMSSTVEVDVYDLTDWGRRLGEAVHALERWAADIPADAIAPPTRWRRTEPAAKA